MQFMSSNGTTFTNSDGKRLTLQIYPGKTYCRHRWINSGYQKKAKEEEQTEQRSILSVLPQLCDDEWKDY